jgi:hypothetical protein
MALHFLGGKPWACYRDFDCNILLHSRSQFADETFMQVCQAYDAIHPCIHNHNDVMVANRNGGKCMM